MTASVQFAATPATSAVPQHATARPAPAPPTAVVIGTLPGTQPVPTPRASGSLVPSYRAGGLPLLVRLPQLLAGLLRTGHARAGQLTAQDKRILAYLAVALIVATGGQVGLDTPAQAEAPAALPVAALPVAALPVGAHVAAATQVLDLARTQIGTVEARDGSTPYHRDYGLPADQPWCAVFLWDMFQDAGGADSIHPKTAYTPTLAGWFRGRGQWTATPTVGALVFYDWPGDSRRRIQHAGIVESFDADTITTIEGNTSSADSGSQDDGDGVWRRTRPRDSSIVGYGLPTYGLAP